MTDKNYPLKPKHRSIESYKKMLNKQKSLVWVYYSKRVPLFATFRESFIPVYSGLKFGIESETLKGMGIKPMSRSSLASIINDLQDLANWYQQGIDLPYDDENAVKFTYHLIISDTDPTL